MKNVAWLLLLLQLPFLLSGSEIPHNLLLADHTTRTYSILSKSGEIIWQRPGKGLFEAWALADGSLLLADRDKVQKIIPGLKPGETDSVVWTYAYAEGVDTSGLPAGIIYTCTPLRNGNILITESGTYRMVELSAQGKIASVIPLPKPAEENQQSLRLARKTGNGNYLVCYMYEGRILEMNGKGFILRTIDVNPYIEEPGPSAYEAIPMENGRLLVSLGPSNKVIILDREGDLEWELTPDDLPAEWNLNWITKVFPRENGNIVVLNYCKGQSPVTAFEITMDKEIVWKLRDPRVKGLTSLQFLTDDFKGIGLPEPIRKRGYALSKYPELDGLKILCVKRSWPAKYKNKKGNQPKGLLQDLGFPANHLSQSSLKQTGFENEIGIFEPATGHYETLYKPEDGGWLGHLDLHWDGNRFLFAKGDSTNWKIYEMKIDGSGLRQVSNEPDDVDCYEPCYLPDGRIVVTSNAAMQCIPCWHGVEDRYAANLYVMDGDGSNMHRLTFDQDHNTNPVVRQNGQVVYSRWDYTGINRLYNRPLMAMNPDGTNQRAVYGSNSYFPNGMYSARELPGKNGSFLSVIAGYHGSYRSGALGIIDLNKGTREAEGLVQFLGPSDPPAPTHYRDRWSEKYWPEFVTPYPLTDRLFIASAWLSPKAREIGLFLLDTDNNMNRLFSEKNMAILEPVPIRERSMPPVLPQRTIPESTEATVYIQDIYFGPGLKGVPRGTIKDLRVIAYDFGYSGMAGMDKIGLSGPWEAMRILGTTPVEEDGSTIFKVPANTPIALQPLDKEGKAVQLMRTWMTAMPGEVLSCVGCHESTMDAPVPKRTIASVKAPQELEEWYGPARGFDFAREVQPVLNRYCVVCHDGSDTIDLRAEELVDTYAGRVPGRFDRQRMLDYFKKKYDNRVYYTPAYEALLPYIRRVSVGDDVSLLEPGEYHADTSELIQLLQQGHYGIELDNESWSRFITWIDLNGPCHGTWEDVYDEPIPGRPDLRRKELAERYGGPSVDPDRIPDLPEYDETPVHYTYAVDQQKSGMRTVSAPATLLRKTIDLGGGEQIELVETGDGTWMSTCEITNRQFARFDPLHASRSYVRRYEELASVGKGMPLDRPDQPVLRVSWERAMAFCQWLSGRTGLDIRLPTESEWERACLAGGTGSFYFPGDDFSAHENLADWSFANIGYKWQDAQNFSIATDCEMLVLEGVDLADQRFTDGAVVTCAVGSFEPNPYGMYDMHGNVAEWTLTEASSGEKIVKGGSFLDRPERAAATVRRAYPGWQNVHNVGFRIVARDTLKTAYK